MVGIWIQGDKEDENEEDRREEVEETPGDTLKGFFFFLNQHGSQGTHQ